MKKLLFLLLAFSALMTLQAQNVVITGTTTIIPDGNDVNLYQIENGLLNIIASDVVKDGKFCITTEIGEHEIVAALGSFAKELPISFRRLYLTPGAEVSVAIDDISVQAWKVASNVPKQKEEDLYGENSRLLWKEYYSYKIKNDDSRSPELKAKMDSLLNLIHLNDIELMKGLPHTDIWFEHLVDLSKFCKKTSYTYSPKLEELYATLTPAELESDAGKKATAYLFPPKVVEVGDTVPDDDLFDLNGAVHHLSDLRGKWVLIDVWYIYCDPCIRAFPEISELLARYKDVLEVVSLSFDEEDVWVCGSAVHNLSWHNWSDKKVDRGILQKLGVNGCPYFIVVDPQGVVRMKTLGYSTGKLNEIIPPLMEQ
ncbi:MAG: TlpA family protein disulfide reductase [Bacteroides sp.]|nr:TlpA family protein disulfide reductase [Bacteroides sp.]MCM1390484.1 TlpA family protein disulfide reductase [Bacteroides sp.]